MMNRKGQDRTGMKGGVSSCAHELRSENFSNHSFCGTPECTTKKGEDRNRTKGNLKGKGKQTKADRRRECGLFTSETFNLAFFFCLSAPLAFFSFSSFF